MAKQLTPLQQRLLEFLLVEQSAGRPFPDRSRIAAHMRWEHRLNTVGDVLLTLSIKGYVREVGEFRIGSGRGRARQWALTDKGLTDDHARFGAGATAAVRGADRAS